MAPLMSERGAGSVMLFTVPDLPEIGRAIYAFISYNLMAAVFFTSMNVPYGVLSSVMTNRQNERAILSISRASLGALGVFLISSYAPDMVEWLGGGAAGWPCGKTRHSTYAYIYHFPTFS